MNLRLSVPEEVKFEGEVVKVSAESQNGWFTVLPRHIDYVATLVPGLLGFEDTAAQEVFFAIDEGVLVKVGSEVLVSVRNAMRGPDLAQLRHAVVEHFLNLDERQRKARAALLRLEADFVRHYLELGERR